jgi:hypothetical protein
MILYYLAVSMERPVSGPSRRVGVFGASGGVGSQVVEQALARGHGLVAFVRTPGKLTLRDAKLSVVADELGDRNAIDAVVRGADAVINALRPSLNRRANGMPLVQGTQNIADAMRAAGVGTLRRHRDAEHARSARPPQPARHRRAGDGAGAASARVPGAARDVADRDRQRPRVDDRARHPPDRRPGEGQLSGPASWAATSSEA